MAHLKSIEVRLNVLTDEERLELEEYRRRYGLLDRWLRDHIDEQYGSMMVGSGAQCTKHIPGPTYTK